MKIQKKNILIVLIAGYFLSANLVFAKETEKESCSAAFDATRSQALELSYDEFDQTASSGFRKLATMGCFKEGADLIEIYIEQHQSKESSLRWHVAQLRAMQGDYPSAVKSAQLSMMDVKAAGNTKLLWNDYVQSTIGFLQRDKVKWKFYRDKLAAGAAVHSGNAVNLKLIDALGRNFDKSYAAATADLVNKP